MNKLRLLFSKTGSAKFISHLDLLATMERALRRAGMELHYSEGYNPHPYLSIALPLPVGCGSICEVIDVGTKHSMLPDGLAQLINRTLPEGLEIRAVYDPMRKFSDISWVMYDAVFHYNDVPAPDIASRLAGIYSSNCVMISKKSKKGVSNIDITPHMRDVAFEGVDMVNCSVKLSAQDPSVSPSHFMGALNGSSPELVPAYASFTRTEIYDDNMKVFR